MLWPIKFVAWLVFQMPWPLRRALGAFIGLLWFDVLRIRRQVVIDNIAKAFQEKSRRECRRLGRKGMVEFCTNIVDYSLLPFLNAKNFGRYFVFHGWENLLKARAEGRGVLLLTLHLGNGDLGLAGIALNGIPIHVVSKEFKTQWLNVAWFGMRGRVGVNFIAPRNSSFGVLRALKANDVVVFVMDQFAGPPIGVKTQFFGHETGTGVGLAVMAERSKAPVVPAYAIRDKKGRNHIYFEPKIPFIEQEDREKALGEMTQRYNDILEGYVRMFPEQWMWLHKRWKKFKY